MIYMYTFFCLLILQSYQFLRLLKNTNIDLLFFVHFSLFFFPLFQQDIHSPTTLYSSKPPFFLNLDFFPKFLIPPSPLTHLIFFQTALTSWGSKYCFPFAFFHFIFFPTALIYPYPLHNLIFFPKTLQEQGYGIRNFIHLCQTIMRYLGKLFWCM